MIRRLGYPCTALGIVAPPNRTCRLANATPERLREMIRDNLTGLAQTLRYNATLGIARPDDVPVVFDALHDAVKPSPDFPHRSSLLWECFATWRATDGPPDTHFSTQDPTKQQGAHGVGIDAAAFAAFAADTGTAAVDCMLEAKGKEQALLQLRNDL